MYAASNAIDLDLKTAAAATTDSTGVTWLELTLDQVHCVEQVIWIWSDGSPFYTWTCSDTDCSTCEGYCNSNITVIVHSEGATSDNLPSISSCKHGNRVRLERTGGGGVTVSEMAVTRKEGEELLIYLTLLITC